MTTGRMRNEGIRAAREAKRHQERHSCPTVGMGQQRAPQPERLTRRAPGEHRVDRGDTAE